jgi:hypothetical protein
LIAHLRVVLECARCCGRNSWQRGQGRVRGKQRIRVAPAATTGEFARACALATTLPQLLDFPSLVGDNAAHLPQLALAASCSVIRWRRSGATRGSTAHWIIVLASLRNARLLRPLMR